MATLVGYGDRLITAGGRESWLKRGSVPLAQYGSSSLALSGDGRVISFQNVYETQPWVATAVNKLNRQVCRLPLGVYREVNDDGESEPVRDHPLATLLKRPGAALNRGAWKGASATSLKQKVTFPALLHGNSVMRKMRERKGAEPNALVPLDWRYLAPLFVGCELVGWQYTEDGDEYLSPEEVIHTAWESGAGVGVSPLKQLGITLRAEDSAQRYQASSFENGARPSGAFSLPADTRMDEDERQELREEIRSMHSGADRNFKIALLTGGATWEPFSHTAVEAELIEQRKLNREEVAAVYDIDPPMIGILEHATYSNVAEMHKMLYGPTLAPWLTLEADTLNAQLVDMEPRWQDERLFVAFDLTEVLKSNTLEEIQAIKEAIGTGVMMPNEGRARLKLRKSDNPAADVLYMPSNNMTPMGQAPPEKGDEPTVDEVVKAHIDRAVQRVASKMGAGQPAWDRDRFVRELKADATDADADSVADQLEAAVTESGGDPETFRRLTADL